MEENERKKLQNDILLMSEISRQYDLYDGTQAKSVLLFMEKRHPLVSARADSFMERLRLLASDDAPDEVPCLLCGRTTATHGVFCPVCQGAIDKASSHAAETEPKEPIEPDETTEASGSEELLETAVEYEIEEEPFSGSISPDNSEASIDEAATIKKRNLRQLFPLIIGAAVAIGLLFYVVFTIILPAQNGSASGGTAKVNSRDDAEKIISREYDSDEYTTEYQDTISMPEGMFEVAVGEPCGDKWDSALTDVMVYYVRNIEDPGLYATLMVAPSGRTIASGTLIMPDDELTMYRIK